MTSPTVAVPSSAPPPGRRRAVVTGVVQGVGFRPFVWRLATSLGLTGVVGNDSASVFVEVQGPAAALAEFGRRLTAEVPPLAQVRSVTWDDLSTGTADGFVIVASRAAQGARTPIPPDVAVCDDCVRELFDPADRRHRHPFVTCTNCGPRFTIIRGLPYDRPNTTMADFPLCDRCAAEYHDPADRRFHAQPLCCPDCGPTLRFSDGTTGAASIGAARAAIGAGRVVAVKGIGGFHLACDATSAVAVASLRARKARGGKPFAVMVRDLDAARALVEIDDDEAAVLTSPARPVVLLRRRPGIHVAEGVAPGSPWLGVLLPCTPVHHLLLEGGPTIVLTSANRSDEPICHTDDDEEQRLPALADAVLTHDRPIHVPCDDSVVRVVDAREMPIRRSRGYAPLPVDLGVTGPAVLAVGGELKNTFCLTDRAGAYCSAHIGDMGTWETMRAFERSVAQLSGMRAEPVRLAADLHPSYLTRSWAERHAGDRPLDLVQHHHAHVVSLLAEHGKLGEPIVGVAFDGTGYGTDATIWGGEILVLGAESHRFTRAAHLAAVPLPGGDAAVRRPRRMALSHLRAAGLAWDADLPCVAACDAAELRLLDSQLRSGVGCVATTSMGRLFDAVASLLGGRHEVTYEGQAAIELEALAAAAAPRDLGRPWSAAPVPVAPAVPVPPAVAAPCADPAAAAGPGTMEPPVLRLRIVPSVPARLDPAPLLAGLVAGLRAGIPVASLAWAFHVAVADSVGEVVERVAGPVRLAGLTGGVFQNVLLLRLVRQRLLDRGFTVLTHRVVPPNDGGLALGQAAVSVLRALDEQREG